MKKGILIIITLIFLLLFGAISFVFAESASLYISPSTGSFLVGSTFTVSIFVNTEDNEINTVWVELNFPPDKIQVTSPTAGTSFVTEWITPPNYSNEKGVINFQGGIPGGIKTSAGLVSAITFRVISSGEAKIEFGENSKVLLNDGKGTNILTNILDGKYNFLIPPPKGPKVFSSTHPSLNKWYKNNNPVFYWDKEIEVTDFSYSLDRDPQGVPDNISEGNHTSVSYVDLEDGVWYFHIKAKKGDSWGGTSHYLVQIDTTPPKDFVIKIEKTKSGFFAYFSTDDLFSGIDYYKISLVDISDPKTGNNPFFIEAISPYRIPFQSAGKYYILVNVYDKAGNLKESKTILNIINPFFSYTDEGIKIGKLFLPWLFFYFLIILSLFLIGWGIYKFIIKRNLNKRLKKEIAEAEKEIEDVRRLENKIHKMRVLEEEARKESERLANKLRDNE